MIKLWKQIAFDMKDFSLRAYELIEHDISGDPLKKYKRVPIVFQNLECPFLNKRYRRDDPETKFERKSLFKWDE